MRHFAVYGFLNGLDIFLEQSAFLFLECLVNII